MGNLIKKTKNLPSQSPNETIGDKYLLFFKKWMRWFVVVIICCTIWQFIFIFIIIFHHTITGQLCIMQYLMFSFSVIIGGLIMYPTYIYANKAFYCNIALLVCQLLFLCFIIPTNLYFWANFSATRINDVKMHITIDLTHPEYVYTACSLWFDFIFSGGSIMSATFLYYYVAKNSTHPWKVRVERETVISKPRN